MATNSTNFPKRSNNGRRCPQYSDTGFSYANPGRHGGNATMRPSQHGKPGSLPGVYGDCMAKAKRPATSELRSWPSAFRTGGNGARGSLPGNGVPRGHGFCLRQRCDGATPATDDNRRGNDVEGTSGALSPTAGRVARRRRSNRPARGRRSGLVRWTRLRRPSRWEGRDEKGNSTGVRT